MCAPKAFCGMFFFVSYFYSFFYAMTKTGLVESTARAAGVPRTKAAVMLESFLKSIEKSLKRDEKVQIIRFGTFFLYNRKARVGVNPRTRQRIQISAELSRV